MKNRTKLALACATILSGMATAGLNAPASAAAPLIIVGQAEASRAVSFDVMLPLRNKDKLEALLAAQHDPSSSQFHQWLTPAQFGLRFGPDGATVAHVADALRTRGFAVTVQTRSLHATGTADQVRRSFGAQLLIGRTEPGTTHVVADHRLTMPAEIAATGAQILSFSPHVAHTHSERATGPLAVQQNRYSADGPYWFDDLKQAYSYPAYGKTVRIGGKKQLLDGTGTTIGVLMSSDVLDSDIKAVFDHEMWTTVTGLPDPQLYARVTIDGGGGLTGPAFDEASLDTQQELTGAPGAHVILYNIPDLSDGNIFAGYLNIIESNTVDLVSSSFGGFEAQYFPAYNGGVDYRGVPLALHELFMQGNAQGITFLASSGDSAGKGRPSVSYVHGKPGFFLPGVEGPANDPNVTAVGGTNLVTTVTSGSLDSTYASENAWSDPEKAYDPYGLGKPVFGGDWGAGGGASMLFSQPRYQKLVTTGSTMRTIPDVGMQVGGCPGGIAKLPCNGGNSAMNGNGNMDRSSAVVGIVGKFYGFIGTSVASPELAGAVALLIEQNGRMGNLNPYLYRLAAKQAGGGTTAFHVNIPGYNGVVETLLNSAYSLSTGVGTPIVNVLTGNARAPTAGIPQTATNP